MTLKKTKHTNYIASMTSTNREIQTDSVRFGAMQIEQKNGSVVVYRDIFLDDIQQNTVPVLRKWCTALGFPDVQKLRKSELLDKIVSDKERERVFEEQYRV